MVDDNGWNEVKRNVHDFSTQATFEGVYLSKEPGIQGGDDFLFESKDGSHVLLWGKTALRSKLSTVKPGTLCRIEYLGRKKSPKSGREYDDFKVSIKEIMEARK